MTFSIWRILTWRFQRDLMSSSGYVRRGEALATSVSESTARAGVVITGFSCPVTLSFATCVPFTRFHFMRRFWNHTFTCKQRPCVWTTPSPANSDHVCEPHLHLQTATMCVKYTAQSSMLYRRVQHGHAHTRTVLTRTHIHMHTHPCTHARTHERTHTRNPDPHINTDGVRIRLSDVLV